MGLVQQCCFLPNPKWFGRGWPPMTYFLPFFAQKRDAASQNILRALRTKEE